MAALRCRNHNRWPRSSQRARRTISPWFHCTAPAAVFDYRIAWPRSGSVYVVTSAQTSRPVLGPGDKLGKHEIIRQIAVGAMAELYLTRTVGSEGFEKLVCVKRILPQYLSNPSFVGMFLNEARLAATLHHPNIAQVYDISQDNGDHF